jgi:sugar phosphate isomerase/epimerase
MPPGSIRLTLCAETLAGLDFLSQCRLAREMGYQGLEVAAWRLGEAPWHQAEARAAEWRRIAASEGIVISGIYQALIGQERLSITSAEAAVRLRTLEAIGGLCCLCAALGGGYVVHGSPEQRRLVPGEEAASRKRGADAFAEAGRHAEAASIIYVIEPVRAARTDFINRVDEAAAIAETSGSPALRTMLDVYSASQAEDRAPDDVLNAMLPRGMIAHLHANDPNGGAPGDGAFAFGPLIRTLRRHGYAGWIGVEPFEMKPDGAAAARRAATLLRGLLDDE